MARIATVAGHGGPPAPPAERVARCAARWQATGICARTDAGLAWRPVALPGVGVTTDELPTLTGASTADAIAAWGGTLPDDWLLGLAIAEGRRGGAQLAGDGTRLALATQRLLDAPGRGLLGQMTMDVLVVDRARGTTLAFRDVQQSYLSASDVTWLWAASGRLLALASHTAVLAHEAPCLFDPEAGRRVPLADSVGTGAPLAFSPSEAVLACAMAPSSVALYDSADGSLLRPTGAETVAPPALSADERRVAFDGGGDGVRVLYLDRRPPRLGNAGHDPRDAAQWRGRRSRCRAFITAALELLAGSALGAAVSLAAGLAWPLVAASSLAGAVLWGSLPLARAWRVGAAAADTPNPWEVPPRR